MQTGKTAIEAGLQLCSVLVAVLFLGAPAILRAASGMPVLFTGEPYYYMRAAQLVSEYGAVRYDLLSAGSGISFAFPALLAGLSGLLELSVLLIVLPIFLGVASVLMFGALLKVCGLSFKERIACVVLLVSSPPFISTFSIASPTSVAVFMSLLGISLLVQKGRWSIFSLPVLLALPFFDAFAGLATIALLLALLAFERRTLNVLAVLCVFLAVFVSLSMHPMQLDSPGVNEYFSELGGYFGIGIFNLLLAFIGVVFLLPRLRHRIPVLLCLLAIIFLAVLEITTMVYLMIGLALFGGVGYLGLWNMRWQLKQIRFLSLVIFACGILFSSAISISYLVSALPDRPVHDSCEWLAEKGTGVVLTHDSLSPFVQAISKKKVMAQTAGTASFNDSHVMFHSRNLEKTTKLFKAYNITHVLIDSRMRNGLVWTAGDEGLLFLFRNNETFRMVYQKEGVEIWEVVNATIH